MMGCVFLLAAALSAGNAEFDRTAAEGAARIAARRHVIELTTQGPTTGVLSRAMLANPRAHATVAASREACRALFVATATENFEAACREIRRRLELPDDFVLTFEESDRKKVEALFPKAYEVERRAAVAEQAKTIVSTIRPTEAEFESRPEKELRAALTDLVVKGQNKPVFEENKIYISEKIVDPMIAGAHATRRRQREYLMRARCDAASPSRLTAELTRKLTEYVDEYRTKEKDAYRVWGVFPSVVKEALPTAVERRTLDRLVSQIEVQPLTVDAAAVEAEIAKDPKAHIKKKDSETKFSEVYTQKILTESFAATLNDVPLAERTELEAFLKARVKNASVTKAIERVVRREVMPKWKTARDAVAAKQLDVLWPSLANGTWYPSAELADETVARSDYKSALRNWRKLSALSELAEASGKNPVLEETGVRVDAQIAQAFDRARSAIAAQNKIVESEHQTVLGELRAKGSRLKLQDVVQRLSEVTQEKWTDARVNVLWPDGKIPENMDAQHSELFPSVRRKIELMAKVILEELSKPQPTEDAPEEPPPEETPSESTSEETPLLEYTISVLRSGDRVEVKLLQGKTPVVERAMDAKRTPYDAAMREVADRLGRDFLKLK